MVPEENLRAAHLTAIVSGPTAAGKTEVAIEFVREFARSQRGRNAPLEIINADSLLVYREMNIGTAKPTRREREEIPHHLIDIRSPDEPFTAGDFSRAVLETLETLEREGKRALIVGGSGFYLKALLYGLWEGAPSDPGTRADIERIPSEELYAKLYEADAESALRIGGNDRYRLIRAHELIQLTGKTPSQLQAEQNQTPDPRLKLLVIDRPSEELQARVDRRSRSMLDAGLIDEVRALRENYPGSRALGAVGYEQVGRHLDGLEPDGRKSRPGLEGLSDEISLATRQLIKRQRTWFKSEKSAERFELDRDRKALFLRLEEIYS